MSKVKKSMITAVCIALCVSFMLLLRALPGAGAIYSPLLTGVIICAVTCGAGYGALCAAAGVLFSAVINGTPSAAMLPAVLAESILCALISGLIIVRVRLSPYKTLYIALLSGRLIGCAVGGIVQGLMFAPKTPAFWVWVGGYFVSSLPGMIIMLVLVPGILRALANAGLVPRRENSSKEQNNGD